MQVANHAVVTEMSDPGSALVSGPESPFVVAAIGCILEADGAGGREQLRAGAEATSWAAVLHRLDVAGRALALDAGLGPHGVAGALADVGALAADAGVADLPAEAVDVLDAWSRARGIPVAIDLDQSRFRGGDDVTRAWAAGLVLAWLVARSGFPPQVVT